MNFQLKFWQHHSITRPSFFYMTRYFRDYRTFLLIFFALDKLNVRHISTSGLVDLLTYKVCDVVRNSRWKFSPSFHQVWSGYDHPLPNYSVIAADTLRELVTLTFAILTLVSGHTWRVKWSTPPPSLKILHLSVLELWVMTSPIGVV